MQLTVVAASYPAGSFDRLPSRMYARLHALMGSEYLGHCGLVFTNCSLHDAARMRGANLDSGVPANSAQLRNPSPQTGDNIVELVHDGPLRFAAWSDVTSWPSRRSLKKLYVHMSIDQSRRAFEEALDMVCMQAYAYSSMSYVRAVIPVADAIWCASLPTGRRSGTCVSLVVLLLASGIMSASACGWERASIADVVDTLGIAHPRGESCTGRHRAVPTSYTPADLLEALQTVGLASAVPRPPPLTFLPIRHLLPAREVG